MSTVVILILVFSRRSKTGLRCSGKISAIFVVPMSALKALGLALVPTLTTGSPLPSILIVTMMPVLLTCAIRWSAPFRCPQAGIRC